MLQGRYGDETTMDYYRFCGKNQHNISKVYFGSSQLPITVKFTSDDRHNAPGFLIQVNFTTTYSMALSEGGFGTMLVKDDGYIMSARYPELVTTIFDSATASWKAISKSYTHFLFAVDFASEDEPSKTINLTLPDGSIQTLVLPATNTAAFRPMLLLNNTKITWIVKKDEKNRLAARVKCKFPLGEV